MRIILGLTLILSVMLMGLGCERRVQPTTPAASTGVEIPADSLVPAETYTWDQITEHDLPDDCWVVIDGVVYDISGFPSEHPGGAEAVTQWCGQDASYGFNTKNDSGETHSARSKIYLDKYFKGNLSE